MKNLIIVFVVIFLIFSNSCKREDLAKDGGSSTLMTLKSGTLAIKEAENATPITTSGQHSFDTYTDAGASGGAFVVFLSSAVGEWIQFTVNVPTTRAYNIQVRTANLNNRGICQLSIDGVDTGPVIDQYAASLTYTVVNLGSFNLTAGNRLFKFKITGKNASSTNWYCMIDYIDLSPDDTKSVQNIIDGCTYDGSVTIPTGTYMINTETGVNLKSHMTLNMSNVILKAIQDPCPSYNVMNINNVNTVTVNGGTIQGDRATHIGTTGEWGMGIGIRGSSYVTVSGVTAKDCWGDGFYVANSGTTASSNITITGVVADNNRRQGLSIVAVNGIVVQNSTFKNTNGTAPMAGIDVEPNTGTTAQNVQLINNTVFGNHDYGILSVGIAGAVTNLTVSENDIYSNGTQGIYNNAIELISTSNATISDNVVHDNIRAGMMVRGGGGSSTGNLIINNYIANNGNAVDDLDYGIVFRESATSNTVTGNTVTGHVPADIYDPIGGNTISGNLTSPRPIAKYMLNATSGTSVTDYSGNGHTGTITGTAYSWIAGGITGRPNYLNALSLNSANENTTYVTVPDVGLDFGAGNFTVAFWVKKRTSSSSHLWGIDKWNTLASPGTNEWCLTISSPTGANLPQFLIESGVTSYAVTATTDIYNAWHHVAAVRSGIYLYIYVDGALEGTTNTGTVKTINNVGRILYIGAGYSNGNRPNAIFDNARIYDYALSTAQVLELKNYTGND